MSTGTPRSHHGAATRTGRRQFIGCTLAAAATSAILPARRLWAEAGSSEAVSGQIPAVSLSGEAISLSASDIKDFRASLRGQLLLARDEGYDQARRQIGRAHV